MAGIVIMGLFCFYLGQGNCRFGFWCGYWSAELGEDFEGPTWGEALALIFLWPFDLRIKPRRKAKEN